MKRRMNELVVSWCRSQGLEVTRSRAYRKNDQASVEQKNGAIVRRLVGYAGSLRAEVYWPIPRWRRSTRSCCATLDRQCWLTIANSITGSPLRAYPHLSATKSDGGRVLFFRAEAW